MSPSVWSLSSRRRHNGHRSAVEVNSSVDILTLLHNAEGEHVDDRIESLVFECLADGITDERVMSLFRVLGWRDDFTCFAIAGQPDTGIVTSKQKIRDAVRDLGGTHCVIGTRDNWCVALIEQYGAVTPEVACTAASSAFSTQAPLCIGSVRSRVDGARQAVQGVLTALVAAAAVTPLPRPMRTDDVLPERALLGDEDAREELYSSVYLSLKGDNADDPTLLTVSTFLKTGNSLETTAKELNVHPNTVRYRLKRAAETTGWDATDSREGYVLHTAIAIGLMRDAQQ